MSGEPDSVAAGRQPGASERIREDESAVTLPNNDGAVSRDHARIGVVSYNDSISGKPEIGYRVMGNLSE